MNPTQNTGIYIHIPFCRSKCPYCDFYSLRTQEKADAYTDAVTDEIKTLRRLSGFVGESARAEKADSVYFGGGTPSVMGEKRLADMLSAVMNNFTVGNNAEITAEVNPSLKSPDTFFGGIAQAGFNRVSIGMQSAVDTERRALGRTAGADDVKAAVKSARRAGIHDISLDVMLGIPMQTEKTLAYTLDFALSLGITHLSCYMLQTEEGTVFYRRRDSLKLPTEDETADMYLFMCDRLKSKGMRRYEISNFCFDGNVSRHNMKYWTLAPYIGIGPSAHSFYGGKRFYFERDTDAFIERNKAVFDCIGGTDEEKIMLSLRTDSGILISELPEKSLKNLNVLESAGLISEHSGRITLTDSGCLVSNSVIAELI